MMTVGMLWFDNNPRMGLIEKIEKARDYYKAKHGQVSNLVFVHPSMLAGIQDVVAEKDTPGTIEILDYGIRANRSVMPNHFWIGVDADLVKQIDAVVETMPVENPVETVLRAKAREWDPLEY